MEDPAQLVSCELTRDEVLALLQIALNRIAEYTVQIDSLNKQLEQLLGKVKQ